MGDVQDRRDVADMRERVARLEAGLSRLEVEVGALRLAFSDLRRPVPLQPCLTPYTTAVKSQVETAAKEITSDVRGHRKRGQ